MRCSSLFFLFSYYKLVLYRNLEVEVYFALDALLLNSVNCLRVDAVRALEAESQVLESERVERLSAEGRGVSDALLESLRRETGRLSARLQMTRSRLLRVTCLDADVDADAAAAAGTAQLRDFFI